MGRFTGNISILSYNIDKSKAIAIERDNIILKCQDYLDDPANIRYIPGALDSIRILKEHGFPVFIITDQSYISRGKITHEDVKNVNDALLKALWDVGCHEIDGLYYSESVDKRDYYKKPNVGMFHRAQSEFNVRFKYVIDTTIRRLKVTKKLKCLPVLISDDKSTTKSKIRRLKNLKTYCSLLEFVQSLNLMSPTI